jgi:hypothetical protein
MPIYHASWAVAGWFTIGGCTENWVLVVVGGLRRDFSWRISVGVKIWVGGGACGRGGGAAAAAGPAFCCFHGVVEVGVVWCGGLCG